MSLISRRPYLFRFLVAIASPLLFLCLTEIVIRVAAPDISMPQAEHHFKFGQEFEHQLPHHRRSVDFGWVLTPGDFGVMKINPDGFRSPKFPTLKRDGILRIAMLGDSCTMGFTVFDDADVAGSVLKRSLEEEDIESELLNFGIDGFSSHQGTLIAQKMAPRFEPDYATVYFAYNDHHYSNRSDRGFNDDPIGGDHPLDWSHTFRFMRRHILQATDREATLVDPVRRVSLPEFRENLESIIKTFSAHGTQVILVTTPLRPGTPLVHNEVLLEHQGENKWVAQDWWLHQQFLLAGLPPTPPGQWDARYLEIVEAVLERYPALPYAHYVRALIYEDLGNEPGEADARAEVRAHDNERNLVEEYNAAIRSVAASGDVLLLDLAALFSKVHGETLEPRLFNDEVHPNEAGHQLIAGWLRDLIVELEKS